MDTGPCVASCWFGTVLVSSYKLIIRRSALSDMACPGKTIGQYGSLHWLWSWWFGSLNARRAKAVKPEHLAESQPPPSLLVEKASTNRLQSYIVHKYAYLANAHISSRSNPIPTWHTRVARMDFVQQQQQKQQQRTEEIIGYRFRWNKHVIEASTLAVPGGNYRLAVVGDCKMDSAMVDEWYRGGAPRSQFLLLSLCSPHCCWYFPEDWTTMRENLLGNINLARVTFETGLAACVMPEGLPCSNKQFLA